MKQALKNALFSLLGKDAAPVVVTFLSGDLALARRMAEEVRELIPDLAHVTVGLAGSGADVELRPATAGDLYLQLRRRFRRTRIAMAPVLFDGSREAAPLRTAACLLAPRKILAYNRMLERHHLKLSTCIASGLFLRGVAVDRIYLRPHPRLAAPPAQTPRVLEGRPPRPGRPRVAVLAPYFPYPLSHGGAVRIFHILREAARDFDIFLFAITEHMDAPEYGPVLDFCTRVTLAGKPAYREPRWATLAPPEVHEYDIPELHRAIESTMREFSIPVLQTEYTMLARYGGQVLVEHDVTFDLYTQIHARAATLSSWWNLWRWRRFERRMTRRFPSVVVMSEKDRQLLGAPRMEVIPNGVDLARFAPTPEAPGRRLLFVGSFRHFPNIEAFRFFVEQVWPRLRERYPDIEATVVGGPEHELHWTLHTGGARLPEDPRIRLLGFVRDVAPLYRDTNLVLVPTTVSAGTNLKVLEAMAMDRAVVSTTSGCAGLGLAHGRDVWVADDAAAFAAGIAELLENHTLRRSIAEAARRLALERYDWSSISRTQVRLWREFAGD